MEHSTVNGLEQRPKISLPLSKWDAFFEALSVVLLLTLWGAVLRYYPLLPATIPTHFNATGQVDGWGNKSRLFSLPVIATLIYCGMTILNRYPHLYNYGIRVTPQNAHGLYRGTTRLLRLLKLLVVTIFLVIVVVTINTSLKSLKGPGPLLLPGLLLPLFLLAGWMLVSLGRSRSRA